MVKARDLALEPRRENTRQKRKGEEVVEFSLDDIKSHFEESMEHIEKQYEVAQMLIDDNRYEDGENIWRSQIVFLDSAWDFYLHEITISRLALLLILFLSL